VDCEGLAVVLGDLPLLRPSHVRPVLQAFASAPAGAICLPVHAGRRGHPVLFDRRYVGELAALTGEGGARRVLDRHADRVLEVEIPSDAILADVDTPDALARARAGARSGSGANETDSGPGSGSH
jgi:molybdenum cofactor cytidylyltransferase